MVITICKNRNGNLKAFDHENFNSMLEVISQNKMERHSGKVYVLKIYKGYDYSYDTGRIVNDVVYSKPYKTVHSLKESELWKSLENEVNKVPSEFSVDESSITTKDWMDGDIMEGNFRAKIIALTVHSDTTNTKEYDTAYDKFNSMVSYGGWKNKKFFCGKDIKDIIDQCLNDETLYPNRRSELELFKETYMQPTHPISDSTLYSLSWTGEDMDILKCYKKQENKNGK